MIKALKNIAVVLLAAMLLSAVSCGDKSGAQSGNETSAPSSAADEAESTVADAATEAESPYLDAVPGLDFKGADFRILVDDGNILDATAESDGDLINDATFNRNLEVSQRFNISISTTNMPYIDLSAAVIQNVTAGDDFTDLIINHSTGSAGLSYQGDYLVNWSEVDYVDFTNPWWIQDVIKELKFNGYMPLAAGSLNLSIAQRAYGMYFNSKIITDMNMQSPYEDVKNGSWTVDKLAAACKDVYDDTNGNGAIDDGDRFGMVSRATSHSNVFMYSCDIKTVEQSDNSVNIVLNEDKIDTLVKKIYDIYYNGGTYIAGSNDGVNKRFVASSALFMTGFINHAVGALREMTDDYGIIPYPKYDEAQETYYSMCGGSHALTAIPVTAPDTAMCGAVVEAMSAYSKNNILPIYYDVALDLKGARDTESLEILDMIVSNTRFSFGYYFDDAQGLGFLVQKLMENASSDFASYYAAQKDVAASHYQAVLDAFASFAG